MRMVMSLLAGLILAGSLATASAKVQEKQEKDDSLRAQILALNDVTGDEAIKGKLRDLFKDKKALRKFLTEASTVAKEWDKEKEKEKERAKKENGKEKEIAPPLNYTGARIVAQLAHAMRDYVVSEIYYKMCVEQAVKLKSTKKLIDSYAGLIDIFERAKKYDESLFVCRKLLDLLDKDDTGARASEPVIREKMVQLLVRQKKFDKAMEMVDGLLKDVKSGSYLALQFMYRKAEVYRAWGKPQDALAEFRKLQEELEDSELFNDEDKKSEAIEQFVKYPMSNVYIDAGQPDKCIDLLEELVKSKPDNSTYHNDLGYVLADNNKRLDEAEKLIRRALELDREERKKAKEEKSDDDSLEPEEDKDNPAYLDSLAWVLFRQKKNAEARDIMLTVVKSEDAQHMEIYDHLGDIYLALGQKDDAVKTWKKAMTLEQVSPRDEQRKESIKKKIEANNK